MVHFHEQITVTKEIKGVIGLIGDSWSIVVWGLLSMDDFLSKTPRWNFVSINPHQLSRLLSWVKCRGDHWLTVSLKLYCRYLYTRPCMINPIWGLKQLWLCEWTCLISFATAPLTCSEQGGSEKFKMKIYVSSGIRTYTAPVHDGKVSALDRSATRAWWWSVV